MKDKLKSILEPATQEVLRDIITSLKEICLELDLDFDLALDKSSPPFELEASECPHNGAYPCGDSVFCPICGCIVKGKEKYDFSDYLKQNHWR